MAYNRKEDGSKFKVARFLASCWHLMRILEIALSFFAVYDTYKPNKFKYMEISFSIWIHAYWLRLMVSNKTDRFVS